MGKRNRQNSDNRLVQMGFFLIGGAIVLIILVMILNQTVGNPTEEKIMHNEGYTTTEEEDPFYKKIVTNNTLDDFYDAVAANQDSKYEEYYFAKESRNFIELKMSNTSGALSTLNITSDLRTQQVKFDYELSYNDARLIMEGNSDDNYACQIITKKSVNDQTVQSHCEYIMKEITVFLERRQELLNNDKVRSIVNSPMKQYIEESSDEN